MDGAGAVRKAVDEIRRKADAKILDHIKEEVCMKTGHQGFAIETKDGAITVVCLKCFSSGRVVGVAKPDRHDL